MISYYELLGMVQEGNAPEKIMVKISSTVPRIYIAEYDYEEFNYYRLENEKEEDENYDYYLSECFLESMVFDKCITILGEEKKIEVPQEFLKDVTPESEIVLIKDDIGHDYGYKNSIGFITGRTCYENSCYIFAFDKRVNRWWECRFEKDEYIRTGLFVSDLFKPFAILTPSKEDEFEDIEHYDMFDYFGGYDFGGTNKELLCDLQRNFEHINSELDLLIKNQKKIIERMKNNG